MREGRIASIGEFENAPAGTEVLDFGDAVLLPGLVDTHVHVNEPGRTEWEGFDSATRAAAAGGVTALFDMPLNSIPPTTDVAALDAKREAAAGRCFVDVGFWGGLVPGNAGRIGALAERVPGFKCFLAPSGVEEFGAVTEADLRTALPALAEAGSVLLVHAEEGRLLANPAAGAREYRDYLVSRPPRAETAAVELLARLCREFRTPIHVVHLSAAEALEPLARARDEGLPLTAETCPHYLFFEAEGIPPGATEFKCAPPIRDRENRERLWRALGEGLLGMIVSDHSPSPPEGKRRDSGDFAAAWGGISSLELSLAAVWSAARRRGVGFEMIAAWMSAGPAKLAGLAPRKGALAPGADADFVVWKPEETFEVRPELLRHRHKLTPYAGRTLSGVVSETYLRGARIYSQGGFPEGPLGMVSSAARREGAPAAGREAWNSGS